MTISGLIDYLRQLLDDGDDVIVVLTADDAPSGESFVALDQIPLDEEESR